MFRKGKGDPPQAAPKTQTKGFSAVSKPQPPQEVKTANQPHRPTDHHPFRQAFSQRRMGAPDCNTRRPPFTPVSECPVSNARSGSTRLPWHMRPLPAHWDSDEVCFFGNWMRELTRLHGSLASAATNRVKLLRRARKIHFMLACQLNEQLRKIPTQTRDAAVKARQR